MIGAADDARAADWLVDSAEGDGTLHSMVPRAFEGYARVFHPAALSDGDVRWADVAAANGRTMHGAAEWGQLAGSWQLRGQEGLWDSEPHTGPTPERTGLRLVTILARHTSTPQRCYFGVWEGHGSPQVFVLADRDTPAEERERIERASQADADSWELLIRRAPAFELPMRRMHLLEGRVEEIAAFHGLARNPPSVWWPADRAWCVGSDVDLMSTYVGGAAAAIEAIVSDRELEALAIPAGQGVTWETDTVNPPVDPPY